MPLFQSRERLNDIIPQREIETFEIRFYPWFLGTHLLGSAFVGFTRNNQIIILIVKDNFALTQSNQYYNDLPTFIKATNIYKMKIKYALFGCSFMYVFLINTIFALIKL